jgi:hypothetical protein
MSMHVDPYYSPPPDPTNPDLMLNIRDYLIYQGLVRLPEDGTHPSLPPMWIEPRYGVPAPEEKTEGGADVEVGQGMVTALYWATGIPSKPYESFIRNDCVDFIIRSDTPQPAIAFENNVRIAINDRRGWMMANISVDESLLFRAMSKVSSDEQGWVFSFEYLFTLWGTYSPPTG